MNFWKQKKPTVVAVLPAASREAGRVITSEDVPAGPAQRRSRLLLASKSKVEDCQNTKDSRIPSPRLSKADFNRVDHKWVAIILLGMFLLLNSALNVWIFCKLDQKTPMVINQKLKIKQMDDELDNLRLSAATVLRNSEMRMKALQLDVQIARDTLQLIEHENRQTHRAHLKPPVYGLNGLVTSSEVK